MVFHARLAASTTCLRAWHYQLSVHAPGDVDRLPSHVNRLFALVAHVNRPFARLLLKA
jgi:hypothetical protein